MDPSGRARRVVIRTASVVISHPAQYVALFETRAQLYGPPDRNQLKKGRDGPVPVPASGRARRLLLHGRARRCRHARMHVWSRLQLLLVRRASAHRNILAAKGRVAHSSLALAWDVNANVSDVDRSIDRHGRRIWGICSDRVAIAAGQLAGWCPWEYCNFVLMAWRCADMKYM